MKALYHFNKVKNHINWFLVSMILASFILDENINAEANYTTKHKIDTFPVKPKKFSEEALIELIKKCNLKYPYIVLAQAKLESAHFTSKVFKQNHNLFGMRKAHQRITSAQGELNTYAFYRDWVDCVYDYAMWSQTVARSASSEDEYFAKLGARYAEDDAYVLKLKKIIKDEDLKSIFKN